LIPTGIDWATTVANLLVPSTSSFTTNRMTHITSRPSNRVWQSIMQLKDLVKTLLAILFFAQSWIFIVINIRSWPIFWTFGCPPFSKLPRGFLAEAIDLLQIQQNDNLQPPCETLLHCTSVGLLCTPCLALESKITSIKYWAFSSFFTWC